jgi:hypothetical protein
MMLARFVRRQFLSSMLLCAVGAMTTTAARDARAEDKQTAKMELALLYGVNDGTKQVPADYPELKDAPWNAYDHYTVISVTKLTLEAEKTVTNSLAAGWTLDTTLIPTKDKDVIKVQIVLRDPQKAQMASGKYSIGKGKHILPVSLPYKQGRLVLAMKFV